jgi:hypothetical protein
MNVASASAPRAATVHAEHDERDTRLHGRWLILARMLWLAIFLLTLSVFCANLITGHYGSVTTLLLVTDTSVWFAVSLVLFWRKSTNRAALLFSMQLVLTGGFFFPPLPLDLPPKYGGAWWPPIDVVGLLAGVLLSAVYTFPDGRFVPAFTRWLALGWIAVSLLPVPIPGAAYAYPWSWWLSPLYALVRLAFYCSIAIALLYRYRWRSSPVERQQIKLVVFAATIVVVEVSVAELVGTVIPSYFPNLALSPQLHHIVSALAFYAAPVLLPLSIGVALLRYRLWDVDRLINKALVYGLLTVLLGACYAGLVIGLESIGGAITGTEDEPIALVLSTLIITVLFLPVRRRLQALIDRRFYRRKYDAEKTLAAFNASLRNEVDLRQLRDQMLAMVDETMQPTHASFWLRPAERYAADLTLHVEIPSQVHNQVTTAPRPD